MESSKGEAVMKTGDTTLYRFEVCAYQVPRRVADDRSGQVVVDDSVVQRVDAGVAIRNPIRQ